MVPHDVVSSPTKSVIISKLTHNFKDLFVYIVKMKICSLLFVKVYPKYVHFYAFLHTAGFIQSLYVIGENGETVNITVCKVGKGNFPIQITIKSLFSTTSMLVVYKK